MSDDGATMHAHAVVTVFVFDLALVGAMFARWWKGGK